jgi:aspartate aminotransferase
MERIDVSSILDTTKQESPAARGISSMARALVGSEILKIANDVRAMLARGQDVLNLTVGDFDSRQFRIPELLARGIEEAIAAGHTNYPPAAGVPEARQAVQELFETRLGLAYPLDSVLIAGGARPMIAGIYYALVDRGDRVVYSLPSWNNNHYCTLVGAEMVEIPTTPATRFFPRVEDLEPHLESARLICLNSPQNPTGTVMEPEALRRISRLIVEENERRKRRGQPALYLMYDQVYWMLTFAGAVHANPVSLVPEMAAYTIFVDGISKGFAATGLRVGWAVGPTDVIARMNAILTHIGAWAPKPEQLATAALLRDRAAVDTYLAGINGEVLARLSLLAKGVESLRARGFDVEAIAPEGAIYLSLRVGIAGKKKPSGELISTDEDIRRYLLEEAGIALVPFTAFGLRQDSQWFRASVGAVSKADCETIAGRLGRALEKLS